MNNEKGSVLPRESRLPTGPNLTQPQAVDKAEEQKKIIQGAPLSTAATTQTSNEEKVKGEKYPWRENTSMSEDELMGVRQKKSYDIPAELLLRLEYLKSKKKPKGFGQKMTESSMILEALDEYTKKELKALGLSVN